jgi:hypothetical protein
VAIEFSPSVQKVFNQMRKRAAKFRARTGGPILGSHQPNNVSGDERAVNGGRRSAQ